VAADQVAVWRLVGMTAVISEVEEMCGRAVSSSRSLILPVCQVELGGFSTVNVGFFCRVCLDCPV
jgi:hypothetical protein